MPSDSGEAEDRGYIAARSSFETEWRLGALLSCPVLSFDDFGLSVERNEGSHLV